MLEEIYKQFKIAAKIIALFMALLLFGVVICKVAKADPYTCVVHKGEWVWIRETPSRSGRKIGRVRYGYEVEPDALENGYFHIRTRPGWMLEGENAEHGYVDAQWFDQPTEETMYRVICEGPLAKRETPEGRLMCWIKPGVKISVLGWRYSPSGDLWAKVYKGGYVKASFLGEM